MLMVNQLNGFNAGGVTYGPAPAYVVKTDYTIASGASPRTQAHTINASTKAMVVFSGLGTLVSISGMTFNSVALTSIGEGIGSGPFTKSSGWYLNAPASGSQTLSISFPGGSSAGFITIVEFDQNILPSDFSSTAGANPVTHTLTPTTALTGVQLWHSQINVDGNAYADAGPSMSGTGVTNIGDYKWNTSVSCCSTVYQRIGTARKTNAGAATTVTGVSQANSYAHCMGMIIGPAPL